MRTQVHPAFFNVAMGASLGFEEGSGLALLNVKIENKKAPAI